MAVVINGLTGITTNPGTLLSGSTIGVGGTTPSASGAGITFPATQSASTDANTLDDYEEGTFTPKAGDGSTAMNEIKKATYTKIGNRVLIDLDVVFPNPNPGTNNLMTNLPFSGSSTNGNGGTGVGYSNSTSITYAHVTGQTTSLAFYTTSGTTLSMSGSRVICSLEYQT